MIQRPFSLWIRRIYFSSLINLCGRQSICHIEFHVVSFWIFERYSLYIVQEFTLIYLLIKMHITNNNVSWACFVWIYPFSWYIENKTHTLEFNHNKAKRKYFNKKNVNQSTVLSFTKRVQFCLKRKKEYGIFFLQVVDSHIIL